jgi:toxin YoeB
MARKVRWSLAAQEDRKAIFTFWNKHNQSNLYSRKLNRLFNDAIAILSKFPFIGRKTAIPDVHIKLVRDYLIVYEVSDDALIIHRIWDGRQDSKEIGL